MVYCSNVHCWVNVYPVHPDAWNSRPREKALQKQAEDIKTSLMVLLDCVDYTMGNCRPNEPVGGVLPKEIILQAKEKIKQIEEKKK